MEIFNEAWAQFGAVGILIIMSSYIIYEHIKANRTRGESSNKLDDIKVGLEKIQNKSDVLEQKIQVVDQKVDEKIDFYVDNISKRIDKIEGKMELQPNLIISQLDNRSKRLMDEHNKNMLHQIHRAPKIHKTMGKYLNKIKCDHIFLGSFHNGTSSVTGVPYYKFDIVAEKYDPENVLRDREFAHMYKDIDILRHDKLPIVLMQNEYVHYVINEDKSSDLKDIDDIVYRRMIGRDIKQLALNMLHDDLGNPIGFLGCVKYDYSDLNFDELKSCTEELEEIYKN